MQLSRIYRLNNVTGFERKGEGAEVLVLGFVDALKEVCQVRV